MKTKLLAALAICLAPSMARADYALVVTSTLCQNQTDSVDAQWIRDKRKSLDPVRLYFFDGTKFLPIGHTVAFDTLKTVVVKAHGSASRIAGVDKTAFATAFAANHASVPDEVQLYSCESASTSDGQSALGLLAAKYHASEGGNTTVKLLSGPVASCALRKPDGGEATSVDQGVWRDGVKRTEDGRKLVRKLLDQWSTEKYPGKDVSFEAYCGTVIADQAQIPAFMTTVFDRFKAEWVQLINFNYDGVEPYTCGSSTGNKTCQ